MQFNEKDLPKIIAYLTKEAENPTHPRLEALRFLIQDFKDTYVEFVFQWYKNENHDSLYEKYEQKLAENGRSCNNGENMDDFDEFCDDRFKEEITSNLVKGHTYEPYAQVLRAVELHTFNL